MQLLTEAPAELKPILKGSLARTADEFKIEDLVYKITETIKQKYYFIPENGFDAFSNCYSNILRTGDMKSLNDIYETVKSNKDFSDRLGGYPQLFNFSRKLASTADCLSLLCAEQAMADVLYKATNEPRVYALTFQELANALERFAHVKKVDNQHMIVESKVLKTAFDLKLKRKLNFFQMDKLIAEYKSNILEYMETIHPIKNEIDGEQILFSLNTDEENSFLDEYVSKRIDFTLEN